MTWIKAGVPSHHTDQQVNMQLLTEQGEEKKGGQSRMQRLLLMLVDCEWDENNVGSLQAKLMSVSSIQDH